MSNCYNGYMVNNNNNDELKYFRTDYMGDAAEGKEEGLGNDLDKVNIADPQFQV